MASLFDIANSGLQAYRKGLSVTGQNIANINTEGFKRREANLEEVTSGTGGVQSSGSQVGLGVRVEVNKTILRHIFTDEGPHNLSSI